MTMSSVIMIVVHYVEVSTLYFTCNDFITFEWLENLYIAMVAKYNHTFFGVRPEDHYMPLQSFTSCSIPHIAMVSPQRPLLAPRGF
jgi:hypothetical protein